jgi:hypothetical protein
MQTDSDTVNTDSYNNSPKEEPIKSVKINY